MRLFLTGATGYVGDRCLRHFLDRGHRVVALTRRAPDHAHPDLTWHHGRLEEPATYERALADVDAVVHMAMEYRGGVDRSVPDGIAVEAFVRSGRYVAYTGNLYTSVRDGEVVEAPVPAGHHWWNDHERTVLEAPQGAAVIRLGFVYGGTGGYLWQAFEADDQGRVPWCGEPGNRWPFVHVDDAATLFSTVIEQRATGVFHAADGQPVAVGDLLATVTALQGGEPERVSCQEAEERLGAFAQYMRRDIVADTTRALETGWQPRHGSFPAGADGAYADYRSAEAAGGR